jgi:hypothetical protein
MDLFSLEALDAASGDALLVHYGCDERRLVIVDGGFGYTYRDRLQPRLAALARDTNLDRPAPDLTGDDAPLPVELLMISHLDTDHVAGVERLVAALKQAADDDTSPLLEVRRLWHNSFDDAVRAATDRSLDEVLPLETMSEAKAASVNDARKVRDAARFLGLDDNPPFDGLVTGVREVDLGEGMVATVVAPTHAQLEALRREWQETVLPDGEATAAAYVDESVPNLSSIVMHLKSANGRTMLLTGDARGDHILRGLEDAQLTDQSGRCPVDLLKVPHHGSDRNLDREFFQRIPAKHYVISGNGRHDNPSASTLGWIEETQGNGAYTIWLTYDHNTAGICQRVGRADRHFRIVVRESSVPSIVVDLGHSSA